MGLAYNGAPEYDLLSSWLGMFQRGNKMVMTYSMLYETKKYLGKTHIHCASKLECKFRSTFTPILYLVEVASFWLICLFMEGKNMCKWLVRHLVTLTCRTYILTSTRLKWLLEYHSSPSRKKLQTWLCTFLWNWVIMYPIMQWN